MDKQKKINGDDSGCTGYISYTVIEKKQNSCNERVSACIFLSLKLGKIDT